MSAFSVFNPFLPQIQAKRDPRGAPLWKYLASPRDRSFFLKNRKSDSVAGRCDSRTGEVRICFGYVERVHSKHQFLSKVEKKSRKPAHNHITNQFVIFWTKMKSGNFSFQPPIFSSNYLLSYGELVLCYFFAENFVGFDSQIWTFLFLFSNWETLSKNESCNEIHGLLIKLWLQSES